MPRATTEPKITSRQKILQAARELFAERGFKGTTTAAIARRAGVNEALIYRSFPGKKDLFTDILRERIEVSLPLVKAAECQCLLVEEAIRHVAERFMGLHDPIFLRLYYHSALEGHELADQFYEQFVKKFVQAMEQLIQRGVDEGVFRPVNPALAAQALTGMFRSYILTSELFKDSAFAYPASEVVDAYCDLFLRGIGVSTA